MLFVSNKVTVFHSFGKKRAGTQIPTGKKNMRNIDRICVSAKPRDGPGDEARTQTSNKNRIMNFYRLLLGLFKDFLLWFGDTMAAVCPCVPGLAHEKTRGAH